jgi:hypothetical protein
MRTFQPIERYKDGAVIGIDDDGNAHRVMLDGSSELYGHVEARTNIWRPMFTLEELENLVRGGKWEEVAPKEETPQPQQHAEKPTEDADARPVIQD